MNRRNVFKCLVAVTAALSIPRLALATTKTLTSGEVAALALRELNTGLITVIGECCGELVGVDPKHLRVVFDKVLFWNHKRHRGRLGLFIQHRGYWSLVGNVQVFDFDEFKRLQDSSGFPYDGQGWYSLHTWLREVRGLNVGTSSTEVVSDG